MSEFATMTNIEKLIQDYSEFKKNMHEKLQAQLKDLFQEFFVANPGVNAIVWTQYTPYFNDGETCVFRVNTPTITNATGERLYDRSLAWGEIDDDDETLWAYDMAKYHEEEISKLEGVNADSVYKLGDLIQNYEMSDIFLAAFDDHSHVIVTRDGIEVEHYEHD